MFHRNLFAILASLSLATAASAQGPTRTVPIGHWTMPYVEHLIRSGEMRDPDPLNRPLNRRQLRRALSAIDTDRLSNATRTIVADLLQEFREPTGEPAYQFDGYAGFRTKNFGRRNPLRAGGEGLEALIAGYDASVNFGNFVVNSYGFLDRQLRGDPEFTGIFPGVLPNRILGNISYQFEHGEVFFGTLDRNWGPATVEGLQISNLPYSYDHFGLKLTNRDLTFEMLATSLDEVPDQNDEVNNRYLMAHRLTLKAIPRLRLSLTETTLIVGVGRRFEIWFLNPVRLSWLAADDQADKGRVNFTWSLDADFQVGDRSGIFGSYMIDDGPGFLDFRDFAPNRNEPGSWGITIGGRTGFANGVGLSAHYTAVSLLSFRTNNGNPAELHAIRGIGLARNFSDYDEITLEASFIPHRTTVVRPEITLLRQGEGDFRQPFPPQSVWPDLKFLHNGIVERTWRFALTGTTNLKSRALVEWDTGFHVMSNVNNIDGSDDTRFVGSLTVKLLADLDDFWWWVPSNW